ncbi:hypothetical protein [Flavobacterium sp. N1994]|uniref:hypothetical protein n=1 Tax=Flavobacterium sp. N1994 TaxID=2986827 RepID=UPI00222360E0|nr:hypothetical protein [Flavobacterium sp. N1994]
MTPEQRAAQELMKATFWEAFARGIMVGFLVSLLIITTIYYFSIDIVEAIN